MKDKRERYKLQKAAPTHFEHTHEGTERKREVQLAVRKQESRNNSNVHKYIKKLIVVIRFRYFNCIVVIVLCGLEFV